jgi:hypothetical protein
VEWATVAGWGPADPHLDEDDFAALLEIQRPIFDWLSRLVGLFKKNGGCQKIYADSVIATAQIAARFTRGIDPGVVGNNTEDNDDDDDGDGDEELEDLLERDEEDP